MRVVAIGVLLLLLLPALAVAQSTGGSFGGGSFGRSSSPSTRSSASSSGAGSSASRRSSSGADYRYRPGRPDRPATNFEKKVQVGLAVGLVAVVLLVLVVRYFRSVFGSLAVGLARRKKSCVSCGAVAYPKRGKCPTCGGEMESIL